MLRAGEFAIRHGPWGLPAVVAARSLLMPRFRSSRNRVRPRFHCFHTTDRSRRRSHDSRLCNTEGVWQSPRFSFAGEAESEKLSLPRSSHGALRLIHLEFESVCEEARDALHHSQSRSFAAHIDVAIVGIPYEAMTTPL